MYFNKIRTNQTVLNKVDRKQYSVNKEGDKFIAVEKFPEGTPFPEVGNRIEMNERNAIAFRLIDDPNPAEKPEGYAVSNGELINDQGEVVETGEIKVSEILGVVPGNLVLKTVRGDKEGVSLYNPEKDSFRFLFALAKNGTTRVICDDDKVFVAEMVINEVPRENSEESDRFLEESVIYAIMENGYYEFPIGAPMIMDAIKPAGNLLVVETIGDTRDDNLIIPGPRRAVIVDEAGGFVRQAITLEGGEVNAFRCFEDVVVMTDKLVCIDRDDDRYYVVTDRAKELAGLTKVVDITLKNHQLRITLANEDLTEVKTLVKTRAEDARGAVYSVE